MPNSTGYNMLLVVFNLLYLASSCCRITSVEKLTVCGEPPVIQNGENTGAVENVMTGVTLVYSCNEGFFPHGENSDKLSTQCLENRMYSLSSEDLATCKAICKF